MAQWLSDCLRIGYSLLVVGSNPRNGIFKIISKIALGLSRIYNTVKIPVKLILWPLLIGFYHALKSSNSIDMLYWQSGLVRACYGSFGFRFWVRILL